jgi:hypothetical protein
MIKPSERERLQDCLLLVQSADAILAGLRDGLVPDLDGLRKCFDDADRALSKLLRR